MMNFEYAIDSVDNRIIVRLSGTLPPGSDGNPYVSAVTDELSRVVDAMNANEVVIDCEGLAYEFGDSLGSVWIFPMSKGLKCKIIATGATKEALSRLVAGSITVPIEEPDGRE